MTAANNSALTLNVHIHPALHEEQLEYKPFQDQFTKIECFITDIVKLIFDYYYSVQSISYLSAFSEIELLQYSPFSSVQEILPLRQQGNLAFFAIPRARQLAIVDLDNITRREPQCLRIPQGVVYPWGPWKTLIAKDRNTIYSYSSYCVSDKHCADLLSWTFEEGDSTLNNSSTYPFRKYTGHWDEAVSLDVISSDPLLVAVGFSSGQLSIVNVSDNHIEHAIQEWPETRFTCFNRNIDPIFAGKNGVKLGVNEKSYMSAYAPFNFSQYTLMGEWLVVSRKHTDPLVALDISGRSDDPEIIVQPRKEGDDILSVCGTENYVWVTDNASFSLLGNRLQHLVTLSGKSPLGPNPIRIFGTVNTLMVTFGAKRTYYLDMNAIRGKVVASIQKNKETK